MMNDMSQEVRIQIPTTCIHTKTDICSICMDIIYKNSLFVTPCEHSFHANCWEEWINRSISPFHMDKENICCPYCRSCLYTIKTYEKESSKYIGYQDLPHVVPHIFEPIKIQYKNESTQTNSSVDVSTQTDESITKWKKYWIVIYMSLITIGMGILLFMYIKK